MKRIVFVFILAVIFAAFAAVLLRPSERAEAEIDLTHVPPGTVFYYNHWDIGGYKKLMGVATGPPGPPPQPGQCWIQVIEYYSPGHLKQVHLSLLLEDTWVYYEVSDQNADIAPRIYCVAESTHVNSSKWYKKPFILVELPLIIFPVDFPWQGYESYGDYYCPPDGWCVEPTPDPNYTPEATDWYGEGAAAPGIDSQFAIDENPYPVLEMTPIPYP